MSNFNFIDTNVDVSEISKLLEENQQYWDMVKNMNGQSIGGDLDPPGFLPLVMGVGEKSNIKNSNGLKLTPAFDVFQKSIFKTLTLYGIECFSRASFFKLKPGYGVGEHIDDGKYYLNKDRFHLSIQGNYQYSVEDETYIIHPGTLFWFDNKKMHHAENIDTVDRITFVFDVPYEYSPIRV